MADKNNKLRPSILERLQDHNPGENFDGNTDQHQGREDLKNSIRRDLENLLNTRVRIVEPGDEYPELRLSILNYGFPDLATVNIADQSKKLQLIDHLETLLITFEPRFKSVAVSFRENKTDSVNRSLKFRIDAELYADPLPEVVVFDSELEPSMRRVNVTEADHV